MLLPLTLGAAALLGSADCKRPLDQQTRRNLKAPPLLLGRGSAASSLFQVNQTDVVLDRVRSARRVSAAPELEQHRSEAELGRGHGGGQAASSVLQQAEDAGGQLQETDLAAIASQATDGVALLIDGKPTQPGQVHVTKTIYMNGQKIGTETSPAGGGGVGGLQQLGSAGESKSGAATGDQTQVDVAINLNVIMDGCDKLTSAESYAKCLQKPGDFFSCYDANGDKYLSPSEMTPLFADSDRVLQDAFGSPMDPSLFANVCDTDGDGRLSQDEFRNFVGNVNAHINVHVNVKPRNQ